MAQFPWQRLARPVVAAVIPGVANWQLSNSYHLREAQCDSHGNKVTRISNVKFVRGGAIVESDLWFSGGRILVGTNQSCMLGGRIVDHADTAIDGNGALIVPGFIDPQLNGAFGVDFTSPKLTQADVAKVARGLLAHGVTAFLPTVVTAAPDVYRCVLPKLAPQPGGKYGAEILGAHCIGPFISKEQSGSHPHQYIEEKLPKGYETLAAIYGHENIKNKTVRLVTLAPELEGAMEAIRGLDKIGTVVSAGHTNVGIRTAEDAVRSGTRFITHLFNAMKTFHHRDPGLVALLATDDPNLRVHYGLIVDGLHVHPSVVKTALRTHEEGCVLVTDSMSALGLGDGSHKLGDIDVVVEEAQSWGHTKVHQARQEGTSTLVGGVIDMHTCFKNLISFTDCGVVVASECAATHAANLLGLPTKGRLDPGCDADFLLLDPDTYELRETWVGGLCAWTQPSAGKIIKARKELEHNHFIGIDIGGTTISVAVVNDAGEICGEVINSALGEDRTPAAIVDQISGLVHAVVQKTQLKVKDIRGFGVCTPGLVNTTFGVVVSAANLPWREVPLTSLLAQKLGVDLSIVTLENDANAALLAEVWVGAGENKDNVVMLTLGTGIGGAILCDGHLLRGKDCAAGELGHTILIPDGRPFGGAGVDGIFEGYASATAVAARALEALPSDSSLCKCAKITCRDVFEHATQGDRYALDVVDETARYLALGCINVARCFSPEILVFTGGMTLAGEMLVTQTRKHYEHYHWNVAPISVDIRLAKLGNDAGVIGAACASRSTVGMKAVRRFEAPVQSS